MKRSILLLSLIFLFIGCETGTRYDKNSTKREQQLPKKFQSDSIENHIDALVNSDDSENYEVEERSYIEVSDDSFDGGVVTTDKLDIKQIREGKHGDYIRLVFDVYNGEGAAKSVGSYKAQYYASQDDITVILNGYQKFSASLPSFSAQSIIEQIYFEEYLDNGSYKLHIKLRQDAKVRIFDLKSPARIIFDIKPI